MAERGVLDEGKIRRQHHEFLGGVLELAGTIPLALRPLLVQEEAKVVVGEHGRCIGPWAFKSGTVSVATTKSVSARKCDNLLISEAHAVEDGAKVVRSLCSIGQTTIRGGLVVALGIVVTTGTPRGPRTTHGFNGYSTSQSVQISIRNAWVLLLDGLQQTASNVQAFLSLQRGELVRKTGFLLLLFLFFLFPLLTRVAAVVSFWRESHTSTVRSSSLIVFTIRSSTMPC